MKHLVSLTALLMFVQFALGARAQEPTKPAEVKPAEPAGEEPAKPAEEEPAKPAEEEPAKPAEEEPAEEGEPTKKSNRRPYTSTEFEMENMSDIEIDAYGKICKIREDSISKMKDLIAKNPNYSNIADVCYRIAEYGTENIKYRLALQSKQYRKDYAKWQKGEMKEEPEPPLKDYSITLPYYEKILIEHPKYPRAEEVLFYLGRNGAETGKALGDDKLVEKSVKVLNKLEEHFPNSQFLPKAYLLSGEYFFNKNNLFEALKYYKKLVENHKGSGMYLYALYKLGWTYYNYQQYDKTLVCFEEVIESLRLEGKEEGTLREMTLKDYIITLSEAGLGWTSSRDFLVIEIGNEKAMASLHQLAEMMAQHGFNDDAVSIYNYFIGLDKNSPVAVEYWNKVLNIYRFNFPFEEVEKQVRQLRMFFREDGAWVANNRADAAIVERASDLLVKWDLSLAEYYLEEGMYFNKGEDPFYKAISRCRGILKQGAGKREEQAHAGVMMAYQGLSRLASDGRIIYVAENVLGLAYPDDYKLPRKIRRMKLDKNEAGFMQAKEKYLALPERTGQKPDLKPLAGVDMEANFLYVSALFHYTRGMNEEGLMDIDLLIAHNPESDYLGWAGDMTFQMSARAGDWVKLQARMNKMLEVDNTRVTPVAQVKEYLCTGMINEALDLSKINKTGDALEKLSTAAQTCRDNMDKAAEALYRLGEVAEAGGFIPQAREAYKKVLDEYGKSKYRSMAQRRYGKIKNK